MTRDDYLHHPAAYAKRGSDLPHARLSETDVRAIRSNAERLTAQQWAHRLGVHKRTVDKVRTYRSWVHVR